MFVQWKINNKICNDEQNAQLGDWNAKSNDSKYITVI